MPNGENLWSQETSDEDALAFRLFAKRRILPIVTSTHWAEALIREVSLASTSGRGEGMKSAVALS